MIFDFSALMVLLVAVSGLIWLIDASFLAPRRRTLAAALEGQLADDVIAETYPVPVIVDYAKSFFPIFLIVLLLRSFLVEPFRIPSGSMIPTLLVGDFILVNKYTYGIRIPVINRKVIEIGEPQRGDIVVFRYPLDPSTPFIKRVIGLPGDRVAYRGKRVYINGREVDASLVGTYVGMRSAAPHTGSQLIEEDLGDVRHQIILTPGTRSKDAEYRVAEGHYFVLGDNRDNSRDSRYWGMVPDENLIGKAFMISMNWDHGPDIGRIGSKIE
jgi:signal peptidase I